jgi:hypothetical protein
LYFDIILLGNCFGYFAKNWANFFNILVTLVVTWRGRRNGPFEDGVDDGTDDKSGLDPVLHVSVLGLGARNGRPEAVVKGKQKTLVNHLL